MKHLKKVLLITFILAVIVLIFMMTGISSSAATYSGKCGDNLTWDLDTATGILEISGTDNIYDYYYEYYKGTYRTTAPWKTYVSYIKTVIIGDSVTSIGNYAFYSCDSITNVTIGDSVTSIGSYAFFGCTSLTSMTIPDSVTSIGNSTFSNCISLTSVIIPESVTSIGSYAFRGCSGLESMTLPFVGDSRKTSSDKYQYPLGYIFGTSSYTGGVKTTQYYYGSSTSSTTSNTYYIPSSLKSVTVTGGEILYGAFYNCKYITDIYFSRSVTVKGNAFYCCTDLKNIHIGEDVTNLSFSSWSFDGCYSISAVYITDLTKWCSMSFPNSYSNPLYYANNLYLNGELVTELEIPDSVTSIGGYAFFD
ncbi:MAG: leucine-rich repeat protein, partial [Clostridia bacterium]|nr:leucine-rich repeat protein [Clostridia bacterium]